MIILLWAMNKSDKWKYILTLPSMLILPPANRKSNGCRAAIVNCDTRRRWRRKQQLNKRNVQIDPYKYTFWSQTIKFAIWLTVYSSLCKIHEDIRHNEHKAKPNRFQCVRIPLFMRWIERIVGNFNANNLVVF